MKKHDEDFQDTVEELIPRRWELLFLDFHGYLLPYFSGLFQANDHVV